MKKIAFICMLILYVLAPLYGQVTQEELENAYQKLQDAKEDKKEKEAAYQALMDSVMYQNAVYAIEERDFVIEAERITFKRGNWRYVTANTNFISLQDNRATVQISFTGAPPGPNGIGGITVEGTISNVKTKTDKKGNLYFSFNVQGVAISAKIDIMLPKDRHRVTATVTPNFSSNRFTLDGYLWATDQSRIFKGRSL